MDMSSAEPPLCVDLDGTLIQGDTLHESLIDAIQHAPLLLFRIPFWLAQGRASLKAHLASLGGFSAVTLPYRQEMVEALIQQRGAGRRLILVSAANQKIADAVGEHLGIFESVHGSTETLNLKGETKRAFLVERFGEKGFDYAGDHGADLPVWKSARQAWVVGDEALRLRVTRTGTEAERVFPVSGNKWTSLLRALRPYQWVKNLLIPLPVILGHHFTDTDRWYHAALAFAAFSLLASAGYVINDVLDRRSDRLHARKRFRPFASGELPLTWGATAPVLAGLAVLVSLPLPRSCLAIEAVYFVTTIVYSTFLKRVAIVDVMILSGLYSVRLGMGGLATGTRLSVWFISFSVFIFLTLALVKRVAELQMSEPANFTPVPGRAYSPADRPLLEVMGVSSGYLSALVMALYLQSPDVVRLYRQPLYLWLTLPLLLTWLSHVWLVAHRGKMHDDPILFTFRDPLSLSVGAGIVGLALLAMR